MPFRPSKTLGFRLRISKTLEVLGLVLGIALLIQANEENIELPFAQIKQPEVITILNICRKHQKGHSEWLLSHPYL